MHILSKDLDCLTEEATLIRSDNRWTMQHMGCDGELLCEALQILPATEVDFHATARVLYDKLYLLLSGLSLIPCSAITVHDDGTLRDVVVFDTLVYRIDRIRKTVAAGWLSDGRFIAENWRVGLLRPLSTSRWLHKIIGALGLSEIKPQKDLFISDELMQRRDEWLADIAYALLKRNPRFLRLRRELRKAIGLDPELVHIALLARTSLPIYLCNFDYSRIWQHEDELRQVNRICPKTAPLAAICILENKAGLSHQPLATLRAVLAGNSYLSPALWKCVITHGVSMFRAVWAMIEPGASRIDAAVSYLQFLMMIGLSVSPPQSVMHAYLRQYRGHINFAHWLPDEPDAVLLAAFREASRLPLTEVSRQFINNFLLVCQWATEVQPRMDRAQRKAGWPWLLKQARAWEKKKLLLSCHADASWVCPVPFIEHDGYVIHALGNPEALVDEAYAMCHCADDYIDVIGDGEYRLFSARNAATMERVATLSLRFCPDGQIWIVDQIKGFANQPLESQLYELGLHVMRLHNAPLRELEHHTRKWDSEAFDEDIYRAVKPHFEVLLSTFKNFERNRSWLFKELIRYFGQGIQRYAGRFANEKKLASR